MLQISINVLFLVISSYWAADSILLGLVELAAAVAIPCTVIFAIFQTRFVQTIQAWLPTLLTTVCTLLLLPLVLKPYLFEAFVVPTNAMAPTLLGRHCKGTCPECGKPNYCTAFDHRYEKADQQLMICENFHVAPSLEVDETEYSGDRFLVAKYLYPRRWDLVVFHNPEEPATLYVKRLIGLPGEKVHIQDGSVWIDGVRQTPPDSIMGLEYLSEIPAPFGPKLWGSEGRPALLSNDEYFVLGDFSARSRDSRMWQRGAPGHNPFAVPASHMIGIVTHTFWPPHRWRIHR
ncbi:signal peptidase I [Pirellulaceae bacterium SH449]